MKQNNSPWLTQLHHERPMKQITGNVTTDIVIVGGGIAGVVTLFFLLKYTKKKIILLEANKIAHGATGHNAGYIVADFEKPLAMLIKEHGIHRTIEGLSAVENAWELVQEIFEDTKINEKVPYHELVGYGGYCELDQLIADIETEHIKQQHGLEGFPVLIARESGWFEKIPHQFQSICKQVDQRVLLEYLETKNMDYQAVIAHKKAVMNSALFTEKLALWCEEHYHKRAQFYEFSFVHGIELQYEKPQVITNESLITCDDVVLCTNGFENFYIHDKHGQVIDTKFHHEVEGAVGYMTGFISQDPKLPYMANFYYEKGKRRGTDPFSSDPYFYVTRRDFHMGDSKQKLFSLGGPEVQLVEREIYLSNFDVSEKFHEDSLRFIQKHFKENDISEKFFWHGLMGYTRSGVRLVGREPLEPHLLYNLGCNGVGILPSIMGGRKIARHIAGEKLPQSIFDPKR